MNPDKRKSDRNLAEVGATYSRDGETRIDIMSEVDKLCQQREQHTRGNLAADKKVFVLLKHIAEKIQTQEKAIANLKDSELRLLREIRELKALSEPQALAA